MDRHSAELALTSVNAIAELTQEDYEFARNNFLSSLAIEGATLEDLRTERQRTLLNHEIVETFAQFLPQPTTSAVETHIEKTMRPGALFNLNRKVRVAYQTAEFIVENEQKAHAINQAVVWLHDKKYHGSHVLEDDDTHTHSYGHDIYNPYYVLGTDLASDRLLVFSAPFEIVANEDYCKNGYSGNGVPGMDNPAPSIRDSRRHIWARDNPPDAPRLFTIPVPSQTTSVVNLNLYNLQTGPSSDEVRAMFDPEDQNLHITPSISTTIIEMKHNKLSPAVLTDQEVMDFGLLDRLCALGLAFDAIPHLRSLLEKASRA